MRDRYEDDSNDFYITQSPVTQLWYVRHGDEVLDERETREGAVMAMRRREVQHEQEPNNG